MASVRKTTSEGARTHQNPHPSLSIVYRDIEELKANPENARLHSKKQIKQIARSIEDFGFNVPFLVDRNLRLIAGHGRAEALKLLGIHKVPTICLEHLSESKARAFMIADNRLAEIATWDNQKLAEQLQILTEITLDFSLESIGFQMGEIDVILEDLAPASSNENDPADDLARIDSDVGVTRANDLWLLGRNRVVCGDALEDGTYSLLMEGQRAACVFIDPPYNDPIDGYVTGFGRRHHSEFKMASGEMNQTEFTEFLHKAISRVVANSKAGSLHYIFMDWRHIPELLAAAGRVFTEFKSLCVWDKQGGGQGSLYRSEHELVFVFKSGKDKHRNNIQLGKYGRYRTNLWRYPRVNSFSRSSEDGKLTALHPTPKPVALVADAIMDCTLRGDIVLDSFLGSGTTLIAADRVGRTCFGIEMEGTYVDMAVRRWQIATGKTAIHGKSGTSFRELEEMARERQQKQ
jgi:DNA modification methylase